MSLKDLYDTSSGRELALFSELRTISIKNYNDTIVVNLLPHLEKILETASAYVPSNTITGNVVGVASEINESSSVVHLSYSNAQLHNSGRTLTVKEPPLEIIIEQPLDERSLVNLSRLVGEHTPASMSQEEAASLFALLEKNQVDHLKIKSTGFRIVFRILEQTFRPLYRLPPQFEHFTGRNQELSALRERRNTVQVIAPREDLPEEEKHDKSISQIAGTGGIGKSQLANYYARLQFREKNYDWIIWMVGGEDDQRAHNNLSSQFADLGLALGLDVKQLKDEVLHKLIYQRLAAKGRGLVVIDDVPNYNVVKSFLPERFDHREIDVLITTRNSHTFDSVLTKILLDVFTLGDAKQYIHRLLKETVTEADAEVLAITLDRYPLALTQALAYILNNHCTIAEYCQRYTTLRAAQKKYLDTPVYEDDPYQLEHQKRQRKFEATMKAVVELSMEQVRTICQTEEAFGRAKTVLLAATYLAPEAAIPKGLLGAWIPKYEGEIEINDALNVLRALSLLEEDSQLAAYRMHQVVQDTLRLEETAKIRHLKLLQWLRIVENYLNPYKDNYKSFDEKKYRATDAHMNILVQHLSRQPRTDEFLEAEASLLLLRGIASGFQGKEKISKSCFDDSLKCHDQISVQNTIKANKGICLMGLGAATCKSGDPRGAKEQLEKALTILLATVGNKDEVVGTCLMNLGMCILDCGDPRGAKEHLQEALTILIATSGKESADAGKCLMNLGTSIMVCGDSQLGKRHLLEAFLILKTAFGEEHPDIGRCLMNLGLATLPSGDFREAKKYLETALPILKTTLGEKHADIGRCLMSLGLAFLPSGDFREAKKYLETALPILKASLGEKHKDVGICLMNLGIAIDPEGDTQLGKSYFESALAILKIAQGEKHMNVGICCMALGKIILSYEDSDSAKPCLETALQIFRDFFGDDHEYVKKCQSLLAEAYQDSLKHIQPVANKDQGRLLLNNWNTEDPPQAIRRAATHGTSHELSSLLQQFPAYINGRDSNPQKGYTALHWAVLKRRADNIAVLLELGARVDIQDNQGRTIIDCALEDHHPPIIDLFKRALLRRYKDNYMGESQLDIIVRLCAQNNDTEGLKLLIHLKVPLDHADTNTGQTALHLAVINGDENFIRLLLEAGADRSLEDFMGNTALSLAEEKNELLMDKIADDVLAALSDDGLEDTSACSL